MPNPENQAEAELARKYRLSLKQQKPDFSDYLIELLVNDMLANDFYRRVYEVLDKLDQLIMEQHPEWNWTPWYEEGPKENSGESG